MKMDELFNKNMFLMKFQFNSNMQNKIGQKWVGFETLENASKICLKSF